MVRASESSIKDCVEMLQSTMFMNDNQRTIKMVINPLLLPEFFLSSFFGIAWERLFSSTDS